MLDKYANPEVTGIKLLMPAGEYYLGDPCYVLDSEWETVCAALEGKDIGGPILRSDEGVAIAFSTAYGDGRYEVKKGYHTIAEVPVDAGLIGLVPVALVKIAPVGLMVRLEFSRDFECTSDGKVLKFGKYEVATDD